MKNDLTDITLVVDRSGSMDQVREDAEGGVNAFIQEQAKQPGQALLTLLQFDTEYELVHRGVPVAEAPPYKLEPRGMTALLDAIGTAINETGQRLAKLAEDERPGLVIFVVMTDGLENSSKEFTRSQIKKMIEHQQDKYGWHFNFLGANQDAFAEAGQMGMSQGGVADYALHKVASAHSVMSSKVSRMRAQHRSGESVSNDFTEEEREEMS